MVDHFDTLQVKLEGYDLGDVLVRRTQRAQLTLTHPNAITGGRLEIEMISLTEGGEIVLHSRLTGMSGLYDDLDESRDQLQATTAVIEALRLAVQVSKMITTKNTPEEA